MRTILPFVLVLVLMTLIVPAVSRAGEAFPRGEHLEPVEYIRHDGVREYRNNVRVLLHRGFGDKPIVYYSVSPSFAPEYAWALVRRPDGMHLRTNIMMKKFWYAEDKGMSALSDEIPLEPELAEAIGVLFRTAVGGTRRATWEGRICDGVVYEVGVTGLLGGLRRGQTHSPPKGSPMYRLTEIGDEIFALPEGTGPSQAELVEKIRRLVIDLREAESGKPEAE